jgi:hypothetical protein
MALKGLLLYPFDNFPDTCQLAQAKYLQLPQTAAEIRRVKAREEFLY